MKWLWCLVPFIVMYLFGSFIELSFNVSEWEQKVRAVFFALALLFSLFIVAIMKIEED